MQIRRGLLDLAKHHFGPQGAAANHHTDHQPADEVGGSLAEKADEPEDLAAWSRFHTQSGKLPADELEVFDLVYYQGLAQDRGKAARVQ